MKQLFVFLMMFTAYTVCGQDIHDNKRPDRYETLKKFKYIADDEQSDSIPSVVYDHMDKPPVYPGQ